ncbi:MAG: hypothetical protein COA78_01550 [Blastopirellula sp.]|nr:MAG: hypothetical protein COA78_01550 [Blastopirellula sp.]
MLHSSSRLFTLLFIGVSCFASFTSFALAEPVKSKARALPDFRKQIEPILETHCYDCHGFGEQEGDISLDSFTSLEEHRKNEKLWLSVWKNIRSETMPPSTEAQPTAEEKKLIEKWIEGSVFKLDPSSPDPGRVTIRRLNRTEYHYVIQDMLGVDFDTSEAFPIDDTGYGFDTIGDVLSISPLLMEKYIEAAREIVKRGVPTDGPSILTTKLYGSHLKNTKNPKITADSLPFTQERTVEGKRAVKHAGRYRVSVDMTVMGSDEATSNTAKLKLTVNNQELKQRDLGWDNRKHILLSADVTLDKGDNLFQLQITPDAAAEEGEQDLTLKVRTIDIQGPLDGSSLEYPPNYQRIFFDGLPPTEPADRAVYAGKILDYFGSKAFRRPIDELTLDRLVSMAMAIDQQANRSFEDGIAHALTAILSSPRFLFRAEIQPEPNNPNAILPLDDFALASRLSFFLWSSLPDDELWALAEQGKLKSQLHQQVDRMLADEKSDRFVENFVGQWLQTKDVETNLIDPRIILGIKDLKEAFKIYNRQARKSMRLETEMFFADLMRNDGRIETLLHSDYTFLNEELVKYYQIEGLDVKGSELRKVKLPADSHRGGLLTQGTFLIVTSNPARTSPVKRGLFILDNILGTPAPPAPPDVPALEEVTKKAKNVSMREALAIHREKPLCNSCHSRMDPLGLAFENYNAIGQYRDNDHGKPIETGGTLITGEEFADIRELSQVLATDRRQDFYRCLTEKMLTFALGRGIEYYDTPTIDIIVAELNSDHGKLSTLIHQIVDSAPFRMRRGDGAREN